MAIRRTTISSTPATMPASLVGALRRWLRAPQTPPERIARTPAGVVVYAVGDIHGCLKPLRQLLALIREDAARSGLEPILIFLGDYIDRGPDSKGVVDELIWLSRDSFARVSLLRGNHDDALLRFIEDPIESAAWLDHGGGVTLQSYDVTPPATRGDPDALKQAARDLSAALPPSHLEFFQSLGGIATIGDYVFVHAGLRPGVSIEEQTSHDILWIRSEFLNSKVEFPKVVVHGHTPVEVPYRDRRRIGVDTGAYATGVLTAVRLRDDSCSFLQAGVAGV